MMNKAEGMVYEVHSVISDILYEAERGKISWQEAVKQIKNELKSIDLRKVR